VLRRLRNVYSTGTLVARTMSTSAREHHLEEEIRGVHF